MLRCIRRCAAAMVVLGTCWPACAAAPAADPAPTPPSAPVPGLTAVPDVLSIGAALQPPRVLSVAISPDGQHLAAIINQVTARAVMLVKTSDYSHRQILQTRWERDGHYKIRRMPHTVSWITPTVIAVDHGIVAEAIDLDGKRVADLGGSVIGKAVPADPESPLALIVDGEDHDELAVVNVKTREKRPFKLPSGGRPVGWAFDGLGRLRAVTLSASPFWRDSTTLTHWYRGPTADTWTQLGSHPVTQEGWRPLAASADGDELLVASREGRDTSAIFSYDPLRRQLGEVLASHPHEDIVGLEDPRGNQHPSVVTMGMKPVRHWFDGRWAGLQKAVDQAMPGRINVLSGQPRGLVLVFSYADVDPGRWFTLDTRTMSLRPVFVAQPEVDPARMRPMESLTYPAPDGLSIPAFLTRPAGAGPHPLVVMVHGGPAVRDHWLWDAEVQLLATRGYAVLQPQFRGSTGFGRRFERAGDGQWGLLMQDDISAGVRHLVDIGVVDRRRVCIYGASYGGYAAVWGLLKTPELYRCGVTLAGVSDINHLFTDWNDVNKIGRELWKLRIGDRERDRAKFDSVSPLLRAGDLRAPLLIAHGEQDERVPIGHAKRLMKALDAHGKAYQWLPLPYADHSLSDLPSRALFTTEWLRFIDRHIGSQASP